MSGSSSNNYDDEEDESLEPSKETKFPNSPLKENEEDAEEEDENGRMDQDSSENIPEDIIIEDSLDPELKIDPDTLFVTPTLDISLEGNIRKGIPKINFSGCPLPNEIMVDPQVLFQPISPTGFLPSQISTRIPKNILSVSPLKDEIGVDPSVLFGEPQNPGFLDQIIVKDVPLSIAEKFANFEHSTNLLISKEGSMESTEQLQKLISSIESSSSSTPDLEFEKLLGADGVFPRAYSDMLRGPIVVIIKEDDEYSCNHVPVLHSLNYLMTVLSKERFPVTHRKSEFRFDVDSPWSGSIDPLDSFSEKRLSTYTLAKKIEFADLRKVPAEADILFGTIQNRLAGVSLQEFGFGVFATEEPKTIKEKIEKCWVNAGYSEVCKVIICSFEDGNLRNLCSRLTGYDNAAANDFHKRQKRRQHALSATTRLFDPFVSLGPGDEDRYQYPDKVACFAAALFEYTDKSRRKDVEFEYGVHSEGEPKYSESMKLFTGITEILLSESLDFKIETEVKEKESDKIPDIKISDRNDKLKGIIEFESLIRSVYPMKTIDSTMAKYVSNDGGGNIFNDCTLRLVVSPEAGLLFHEQLLLHENYWKRKLRETKWKIQFCTLNPPKKGLYRWTIEPIPPISEDDDGQEGK